MAQQVLVQLIDDLDGTASHDVETVQFGLDGAAYEIDLSDSNAQQLRKTLAEYVGSARRTGGRAQRGAGSRRAARADGEASRIREWAQANGVELAARGRIPGHVLESYRQAQADPTPRKRRSGAGRS